MSNGAPSQVLRYGTSAYPVIIGNGRVFGMRRKRLFFNDDDTVDEPVENFVAVAKSKGSRNEWTFVNFLNRQYARFYLQVLLVHRSDRSRNLVLWERETGAFGNDDEGETAQRQAWEAASSALQVPAISSDDPFTPRGRGLPGTPEQVFARRFPDELSWGIASLVEHGRLVLPRALDDTPAEFRIQSDGNRVRIDFRYSALWEVFRWLLPSGAIVFLGMLSSRRFASSDMPLDSRILMSLAIVGTICALIALIVVPILHFLNGSTIEIDEDTILYRPGQGSSIMPGVKWEYRARLSKIEAVRRKRLHVRIETDEEIFRIRCPNLRAAKWMESGLLSVAAYGPSVLTTK